MDSPTTPEAVPQTTPKHSTKLAWILLAIILILGSGIGGFFLGKQIPTRITIPTPIAATSTPYPTPDETAAWQIYTHPQNLYSFKYGPGFVLTDYSEGNYKGVTVRFLGPTQAASGRTQTSLSDGVIAKTLVLINSTLPVDKSIEESRKKELNVPTGDPLPDISPISKTTLDSKDAYWYTIKGQTDAKVVQVALNSSTILQIVGLYTSPKYLTEFDQILSTFKFEKSNVVINTLREIKDLEPSLNWSAAAKETFKYPLEGNMYIYGRKMTSYPTSKEQVLVITNYLAKNWSQDKTNSVTSLDTDLGTYTKTINGEKLLLMYEYTGRDFWVMITNEF